MYTANVDSIHHTFQASGSLWQDALVMQDLENKTLWAQITGEAIQGDLIGKKLEMFNSFYHSTFAEFKKQYPSGVLLKKEIIGDAASHYQKYMDDSTKFGIFERADTFNKLSGKELVFGIRHGEKVVAISKDYLIKSKSYSFNSGDITVVINYDNESNTVVAYEKKNNKPVGVVTAFWFAWISFFSETELIH